MSGAIGRVMSRRLLSRAGLRQLGRDGWNISRNVGRELLQDHKTVKQNSLILSAFLLVLYRIFVSNKSAMAAKGTPEYDHRKREAYKTTLREAGGFTLSYLVFRTVEGFIKKSLRKLLGAENHPSIVRSAREQFKNALAGKPVRSFHITPDDTLRFTEENLPRFRQGYQKWIEPLYRFFGKPEARLLDAMKARANRFYQLAPGIIGMIPAVILSGYYLERFTRDHAEGLIERLTGGNSGNTAGFPKNQPLPNDQTAATRGKPSLSSQSPFYGNNGFENYMRAMRR